MVENFFKYVKTELDTSLPIIPFVENYRENLNELSVEYLSGLIEGYGEDGKKEDKKLIKILSDKLEENYVTPTETETWCRKTKRKPGNQYLRPSKKAKFHCSRPEAVSSESGEDDDELPVEPVDEGEKGEHEQKEGEDSGANLKSVLNIVL